MCVQSNYTYKRFSVYLCFFVSIRITMKLLDMNSDGYYQKCLRTYSVHEFELTKWKQTYFLDMILFCFEYMH